MRKDSSKYDPRVRYNCQSRKACLTRLNSLLQEQGSALMGDPFPR